MIKVNWIFFVIVLATLIVVEIGKFFLKKFKLDKVIQFIPLILFVVTAIIYGIITRDVLNMLINALALTACSCYFFDLIKPIVDFFKKKIYK